MSKLFAMASVASLILAVVLVVGIVAAILFLRYTKRHPPKTALLKMVKSLAEDVVIVLDEKDESGTTKLHSAITFIVDTLKEWHIKVPDNIERIAENAVEAAVANLRASQATAYGTPEAPTEDTTTTNSPVAASNLPAASNGIITQGTAASVDTGDEDDTKVNVPVHDEDDTDTTTAPAPAAKDNK